MRKQTQQFLSWIFVLVVLVSPITSWSTPMEMASSQKIENTSPPCHSSIDNIIIDEATSCPDDKTICFQCLGIVEPISESVLQLKKPIKKVVYLSNKHFQYYQPDLRPPII